MQSNRIRSTIVWEIIKIKLKSVTNMNCSGTITDDPSYLQTKMVLQMPCMSKLLNTCQGGLSHIEMEPFFTHRPEAHPGARCAYTWPAEFDADPTGELCNEKKSTSSDCTHVRYSWNQFRCFPFCLNVVCFLLFALALLGATSLSSHMGTSWNLSKISSGLLPLGRWIYWCNNCYNTPLPVKSRINFTLIFHCLAGKCF